MNQFNFIILRLGNVVFNYGKIYNLLKFYDNIIQFFEMEFILIN